MEMKALSSVMAPLDDAEICEDGFIKLSQIEYEKHIEPLKKHFENLNCSHKEMDYGIYSEFEYY